MTDITTNTTVLLETSAGNMTVEFFHDKAPGHVANFVKLASEGFYDGTRFHRVIPGFMIQGGDPNTKKPEGGSNRWGTGDPGYKIKAEFNDTHHERGVLSMARSQDPDSAGCQFFVCHGEASFLNNQYTAFGKLADGFEALDAIAGGACKPGGEGSSPLEAVTIVSAKVVEADA